MKPISQMTDEELEAIANSEKPVKFKTLGVKREFAGVSPGLQRVVESSPKSLTITSGRRSPEVNKMVGGVPNSLHQTGDAIDIRKDDYYPEAMNYFKGNGLDVLDEGDHLHVQGKVKPPVNDLSYLSDEELEKIAGQSQKKQDSSVSDSTPFLSSAPVSGLRKFTQSATAGLSEPVAAGLSAVVDKGLQVVGKLPERGIGEAYEGYRADQKKSLKRAEEDSPVASFVGELGGYVAPGGLFGKATQGATKAVNFAAPVLSKVPTAAGRAITKSLLRGGLANTAYQGINPDSETSPLANFATGGVGDLLGTGIQAAGKSLSKLPPKMINRMLGFTAKELGAGKGIGQEFVDRGIVGTQGNLLNKAESELAANEAKLQSVLSNTQNKVNPDTVKSYLSSLRNKFAQPTGEPEIGLEKEASYIDDLLSNLENRLSKPMSASEANEVKRKLYKVIGDPGYLKENPAIAIQSRKELAKGFRKAIEDASGSDEVAKLNKELGFHGRLKKQIQKTQSKRDAGSISLPSLFKRGVVDSLAGAGGAMVGGPLGGLAGVAGGEAARSTLGQTSMAQMIKYLSELLSRDAIKKGTVPISSMLGQKIQE